VTKLTLRGLLLAGGVAIAGVVAHSVLRSDSPAATAAMLERVTPRSWSFRPPAQPARHAGEPSDDVSADGDLDERAIHDASAAESDGEETLATEAEAAAPGFTWFRFFRPDDRREPDAERRGAPSGGGGGFMAGTPATTTTGAASAAVSECKQHDLTAQAQGVSADVDFVGVLLKGGEVAGREFTAAELGDVKIVVRWKNLFGNHQQRLELIAPDGSVYQSLLRPLTVTDAGLPVITLVPVSGTWITRNGLFGSWCVDVYFDQDERPLASRRLVISG
jgi:hypothetical protein